MPRPDSPRFFMVEWTCRDWPGCVAWYSEILGLRRAWFDETSGFALFEGQGVRIALKASAEPARGLLLSWEVDDIDAAVASYRARGAGVSDPIDDPEGFREARFPDPEGRIHRLFQWVAATPPS